LESLRSNWPDGPAADVIALGIDRPDLSKALAAAISTIRGCTTARPAKAIKSLQKCVKTARDLLKDLNPDEEDVFRNIMQRSCAKIAKLQVELKSVSHEVQACSELLGETFETALPDLSAASHETDGKCLYFVCVFTAICFYRSPATFQATQAGKKSFEQLRAVLAALQDPAGLEQEEHYNHEIVKEVRESAKVPRPTLQASGQVGKRKASGTHEGQHKPLAKSEDHHALKRQRAAGAAEGRLSPPVASGQEPASGGVGDIPVPSELPKGEVPLASELPDACAESAGGLKAKEEVPSEPELPAADAVPAEVAAAAAAADVGAGEQVAIAAAPAAMPAAESAEVPDAAAIAGEDKEEVPDADAVAADVAAVVAAAMVEVSDDDHSDNAFPKTPISAAGTPPASRADSQSPSKRQRLLGP